VAATATGRTDKAVIMARGLGTRMRQEARGAQLDVSQAAVADTGVKAMIPIGRPFLDFVLSALADAGFRRVCLVIGPEHGVVRDYYDAQQRSRIEVSFAVQEHPRGTADAVAAAAEFVGSDHFLVVNSDNYYPVGALAALRALDGPGLAGFSRATMIADGNIPAERVAKFAVARFDAQGFLDELIEKPSEETMASLGSKLYLSMNCWLFPPAIIAGCRRVAPSPRSELELTDAVLYTMRELGVRYRVLPLAAPVLDLSSRLDIATVADRLRDVEVRL
jgi:dTDP-glucose pyrophosphorylase